MKKLLKFIKSAITIVLVFIFLFITVSYVNHKIQLSKEDKLFIPNGQMVNVNGHNLHVYTEGEGPITLVFMSGGGTCSPVLDFKSLYSPLSKKYKIVVVEKAGYGFSDVVDIPRDIDSVLSDTREALSKAKIGGPYILCPHSMSGIEALYWTQKYPDEVKGIIGLDMSVPQSYEKYNINTPLIQLGAFASNIGITRWIPSVSESDAIKYGTLTDKEKELYKAIFYRRTATKTMINEVKEIKKNATKVSEGKTPNIPILMFSSNGKGTGWNQDVWRTYQKSYMQNIKDGKIIYLNCSHYVHDIEYEKIEKETEEFIKTINYK